MPSTKHFTNQKGVQTHTRKTFCMPCVCVFESTVKSEILGLALWVAKCRVSHIAHTHTNGSIACVLRCRRSLLSPKTSFLFLPFSALICLFRLSLSIIPLQIPTPVCLPSYLPWLPSSSSFPLFLLLPPFPSPQRATVGQTSLVVSSVDFLEPLREEEELATDNISVKDMEP